MERGRPLERRQGRRRERQRFLIYCEGENTEKDYFAGMRDELRSPHIELVIGKRSGEPLNLVHAAIKHRDRAPNAAADRRTPYDEVWCVMDVEAPTPHGGLDVALKAARTGKIHVALSNPCFELWILLYFRENFGYQTSKQAQKRLEKLGSCGYQATRKNLDYTNLRSLHDTACTRAKKLRERSARDHDPSRDTAHRQNPWTDVDRLVARLLDQCRQTPGIQPSPGSR